MGIRRITVPLGSSAIRGGGNLTPFFEHFQYGALILLHPATAITDQFLLNEDADGRRTPVKAALVKGGDYGFNVALAFAEDDLLRGFCPGALWPAEAALV